MWDEKTIQIVWEKGKIVPKYDKDLYRKDQCDAWIKRDQYGKRNTSYGWEIDHIKPDSKEGSDTPSNLRPLHWKNNASRQDGRLKTVVTAEGNHNIVIETGERI